MNGSARWTDCARAGRMAADYGVVLAIEPLNRYETDLINTAEQVVQLIRDVDHTSVKIHLDTFHMNIEEKDIYGAVTLAGPDLVYVDASESDRGAPGSGQVNWEALARALKEINYSGDCVIESFTPECQTIAAAAAIWRPLAASQDALAEDGLKFLRRLLTPTEMNP
ncbi:MAG: sugar phosphate isomerase/epimerase family protein [Pyrinomonadaceae bacterium]